MQHTDEKAAKLKQLFEFLKNQNHAINAWYAQALKGHVTGKHLKTHRTTPPTVLLLQAAAKAACCYALEFLLPVNGSGYSLKLIWSAAISSCN